MVQAVAWYLRYPLSYRDLEEMFRERSFEVYHSTVNRWVLAYAPLFASAFWSSKFLALSLGPITAFHRPICVSTRLRLL